MKIVVCKTIVEPRYVLEPSKSQSPLVHYVIPSTIWNDPICDCLGYFFNGKCRHITEIEANHCTWVTKDLSYKDLCPNCNSETKVFELDPEW
jgi:hypothetical protein